MKNYMIVACFVDKWRHDVITRYQSEKLKSIALVNRVIIIYVSGVALLRKSILYPEVKWQRRIEHYCHCISNTSFVYNKSA